MNIIKEILAISNESLWFDYSNIFMIIFQKKEY